MNQIPNIEEVVEKMLAIGWDSKLKKHDGTSIVVSFTKAELCDLLLSIEESLHHQLQKARQDWLQEEMVRLKGMKNEMPKIIREPFELAESVGKKMFIDEIIKHYQAELDQDK